MQVFPRTLLLGLLIAVNATNVIADCCKKCGSASFFAQTTRYDATCAFGCYVVACFDLYSESQNCGSYYCDAGFNDDCWGYIPCS
jgi:hypothetical protein